MSWGERSCTHKGDCPHEPTPVTCNVNCPRYVWDRKTKPDSSVNPLEKKRRQDEHKGFMKRKPLPRDLTRNQRKRRNRKERGK
jgi:hypothetical protein